MEQINLGSVSFGGNGTEERNAACPAATPATTQKDYYYERFEDYKLCAINNVQTEQQGRILDLSLTLRSVQPGKRVAVGVVLTEVDTSGNEYPRGTKILTVPAHYNACCKDVEVAATRFILPEDISVDTEPGACSDRRHFIARVTAHYIDMKQGSCACAQ